MRRAPVLSRMLSLGVLALLPACTGCASGTVPEDAGSSDADSTPQEVELRFTDTSALQLTPRENVTVELQVMRAGEPAPGITVRLGLEGDAHDASLMEVSLLSGADGSVRTTLRGSSIPATFRLRATASAAAPAFLAVGVSATGFGNVLAGVEDLSATGPARLRVEAYSAAGCDHPSVAEGRFGRAITLLSGESSARFLGLPAGTGYAIVARGESASGAELAFGCVDDVQVTSDAEAMVTVRLGARVQVIAGQYDAEFNVPAAALVSLLAAGRDATVAQQLPAGDAAFLLDALEAHLTGVGDTDALLALAALQVARTTGLEAAFAQHLVDEGAGPSVALGSALSFVSSQVGLTLAGALTIEANGDTSFTSSSLVLAGPMGGYAGLPAADGALPALSFVTELDLVGAVVMFDPVVISLPLGANLEAIVADAVALSALGSWGALSGAGSAAGFSNPAVNGVCDEVCRAAVFANAAGVLRDAWFDTLGRDVGSATLTLSGGAVASDPDGDFRANALDAELGGDAVVGVTTLPIVGTLSATRSAAPVLP
ncbi:MAG: hypothetical protein IPN77_30345 [Sandaracinaceae bacterium]|nr:hypothetical protein [Sandaracinaceae bacterium]